MMGLIYKTSFHSKQTQSLGFVIARHESLEIRLSINSVSSLQIKEENLRYKVCV